MIHTTNSLEDVATSCACPELSSIPFLDTSCQIINGQIILDLYKKPTDRNMYLLPSSCHPPLQHENIPFSAAMRINRICTEKETRDHRLSELKDMFVKRNYKPKMIDGAINKARNIPRDIALRKVVKPSHSKRPIAVVSWDSCLPPIDPIQQKHWRSMTHLYPYLKQVFPEPQMLGYKRPKILENISSEPSSHH